MNKDHEVWLLQQLADLDATKERLAATEENLELETALLTEARQQNADLMAIIDKRDEALGFIPLDKGMDMQDELRETKARLAEAERDAARYRYMRGNASFRDRNGPGLYWYLPRFLPGGSAEQLDASIDASITADSASAVKPEGCCLDYPRCDCNSPPEPDNAPAVTGLTQQDYDALVRDAMLWRTRSPTGAGGNARAYVCCEGVGQHAPGCIAQEAAI